MTTDDFDYAKTILETLSNNLERQADVRAVNDLTKSLLLFLNHVVLAIGDTLVELEGEDDT